MMFHKHFLQTNTAKLLALNIAGMVATAVLMALGPHAPPDGGEPGPGDGFYLVLFVVPLFAVFLILNISAFAVTAWAKRAHKSHAYTALAALVVAWPSVVYLSARFL